MATLLASGIRSETVSRTLRQWGQPGILGLIVWIGRRWGESVTGLLA
jgi:hypothetical protein